MNKIFNSSDFGQGTLHSGKADYSFGSFGDAYDDQAASMMVGINDLSQISMISVIQSLNPNLYAALNRQMTLKKQAEFIAQAKGMLNLSTGEYIGTWPLSMLSTTNPTLYAEINKQAALIKHQININNHLSLQRSNGYMFGIPTKGSALAYYNLAKAINAGDTKSAFQLTAAGIVNGDFDSAITTSDLIPEIERQKQLIIQAKEAADAQLRIDAMNKAAAESEALTAQRNAETARIKAEQAAAQAAAQTATQVVPSIALFSPAPAIQPIQAVANIPVNAAIVTTPAPSIVPVAIPTAKSYNKATVHPMLYFGLIKKRV